MGIPSKKVTFETVALDELELLKGKRTDFESVAEMIVGRNL